MLRTTRHARTLLAFALVSIFAFGAIGAIGATAAPRGDEPPGVSYESTGTFQGNPVTGCVRFADDGNFASIFRDGEGKTVNNFGSDYEELNLFVISFWSTPDDGKDGANGAAGIRFLFGAFVFGTVDVDGVNQIPFSGLVADGCQPRG